MNNESKIVVTNRRALKAKYGRHLKLIDEALGVLIAKDRDRDVDTTVVCLDDPDVMAKYNARRVQRIASPVQAKHAIDDVFRYFDPNYLMILGGPDVVPHQPLKSYLYSSRDSNRTVYSDLPYACEADYGKEIPSFAGPTRYVGRLPDVTGRSSAGYLAGLLYAAAGSEPLEAPAGDGSSCLAVSARDWEESTRRNLDDFFHERKYALGISPSDGPDWNSSLLARPIHFINCHGGKVECRFYGQEASGNQDPGDLIAHDSGCIAGRLTKGMVAIAECCYGARLYDPADGAGVLGICNTYLASGAAAFFGSTTAAYGGERTVEHADFLCHFFLDYLLKGWTTGDAALAARLDFVNRTDMDLIAYKTLAQFSLMGDPSLQPFQRADEQAGSMPVHGEGHLVAAAHLRAQRARDRAGLAARGEELGRTRAVTHHPINMPDAPATIKKILDAASVTGWDRPELRSFKQASDAPDAAASLFHFITRPSEGLEMPFEDIELIVAKEVGGEIVSCRHLVSR